jgi:hypothetical protein
MRYAIPFLLCFTSFASEQTPEIEAAVKAKLATLKFLGGLYEAESGGYRNEPMAKPTLRATNAAVKATRYLGGQLDDKEKSAKFVLSCYDDKTGAFAEPGGKPDVTTTCIGVMAAMELGITKEKIAKAPEYITANAKEFEDVRIGAAAFEAWGVEGWKDSESTKTSWLVVAFKYQTEKKALSPRESASAWVVFMRLLPSTKEKLIGISYEQLGDGGWGLTGQNSSDMETIYRVMRYHYMAGCKPGETKKLREYVEQHLNSDGGSEVKIWAKSSAIGTYYAVIITKWLDELEKK